VALGHERGGHPPGGQSAGGKASAGQVPGDEPEVFDLGPMSRGDDADFDASADPVEGARDATSPARPAGQLAALACVLGLVVGAIGYGLWDSHQDELAARARPVLLGQVVAATADEQGQFTVTVALANEGASAVTVHRLVLPDAPAAGSGRDWNRNIEPATISTLLVGGAARCSEPAPSIDRVRAVVSTKSGGSRTITVPLTMSPNAATEFSAQRRYACAGATTTPRLYSYETQLLDPASSATGDAVRLSMTLEIEGRDLGMLTELRPVTSAFSVSSPDLPISLSANGLRRTAIETTWRVNDCAAAARATTADTSLIPIINGRPQSEQLQVWGDSFAELVRLGARVCPTS